MNNMPPKLRLECSQDPYYRKCARASEGGCEGRITFEHALMYAGRQVQRKFAIVPLCEFHHLKSGLNKITNIRLAFSRATPEDLEEFPRQSWYKYGIRST